MLNDRNVLDAPELGIEAVAALWKLYPLNSRSTLSIGFC